MSRPERAPPKAARESSQIVNSRPLQTAARPVSNPAEAVKEEKRMRKVAIVSLQRLEMPSPAIYVPYIHGVLRTYVEQFDDLRAAYAFQDPLWRMESTDAMLARLDDPDVVGFSVYVWNFRNSLRLAEAVKARWPGCLVVFGGPHVPNEPSDFFARHRFVDVCVHGEGEAVFAALLRERLATTPDLHKVRGISFPQAPGPAGPEERHPIFTPPAERLKTLDAPGPYASGCFDGFMDEVRALRREVAVTVLASLETARGCPYSCTFCDWGMSTMTRIRQHPLEKVHAELGWIAANGISTVILNDSNFGVFERDVELMEHLVGLRARTGFPRAFYPLGFAKNNKERTFRINRIIHDAGFDPLGYNVNFSLQTLSDEALAAIGRKNIPLDAFRQLSDAYAQNGYTLSPDLILPLPGETLASFKRGYADLASWEHVRRIRIYPCTILPNAPMAKAEYRERWGLRTRVSPLDPQHGLRIADDVVAESIETVVATSTMSEADVAEAKLFVAFVNALEVYGVTRPLRTFAGAAGVSADAFYDGLLRWMLLEDGVLAGAIRAIWEAASAGQGYADQVAWSAATTTWDGRTMQLHKVVAFDALTQAERFLAELRRYVVEHCGVADGPALDAVLERQAQSWIVPESDFEGWVRLALACDEVDTHVVLAA
jgi:putative methyltransferase